MSKLISKVASEMGKKGGNARLEKYGVEGMSKMAKKGGKATAKRGSEYFREIQKKSAESRKRNALAKKQKVQVKNFKLSK